MKFCLLNTRNKKELILKDFTVENDIDILAVTETWLRDDNAFSVAEGILFLSYPEEKLTRWRGWCAVEGEYSNENTASEAIHVLRICRCTCELLKQ